VLGILRAGAPAGEDPEPSAAPRGGLDRLADLLDAAQAAGLRVELSVDGDPRPLPVPVDLAAYRIIQEALTNVLRHAGARTVRLALTHEPAQLLIRVRDDGAAADPGSPRGTGIDGMRERARALSGRLSAAPHPEGGYEVRAELPIPDRG
jgi:signal transduction histidine kinase